MSEKLEEIKHKIKSRKSFIQTQYKIKEIGLFGSFIRGEETPDSDIDILVEMEKPIDLFQFLELEELLSDLTGCKVDLVSKKALKPGIGEQILQEVVYL